MYRIHLAMALVCAVALVGLGIDKVSLHRRKQKTAVMLKEQVWKREVMEKYDCARVVEVHTYDDGQGLSGWYENRMVLENGRHVTERSRFIKKRGELFCRFWVVPVSN